LSEVKTQPEQAGAMRRLAARFGAAVSVAIAVIGRAEPLYGLAGPLFEKELRVSGRRGRTYIVRSVYLLVLSGFVGMVWLSMITVGWRMSSPLYNAYEMSRAGMTVISVIMWFQFIVLPLVAVVMLSTSISDEIYQRTLGVLLTTPITSLQIVAGKLLSRTLEIGLLLAVSLPMLLLTQALGGVSWDYVASGLCVTLATVILAGCLSMFFSISSRRSALVAILKTLAAMGVLFILLPLLWNQYGQAVTSQSTVDSVTFHSNPYLMMGVLTMGLFAPGIPPTPVPIHWWMHCLVLLGLSAVLFALSVWRVRVAAMRQLVGESGGWFASARRTRVRKGRIHRVRGAPMIWKELHVALLRPRLLGALAWLLLLGLLVATEVLTRNELTSPVTQGLYGGFLLNFVGVCAAITAGLGIAKEREAGTWPLLLVTPLEDRAILLGKTVALLRRSLPACLILAFHFVLMAALGYVHPVVVLHMALITVGVVALVTGTGLYFSTLVRRPTAAILLNLGFVIGLWAVVPMMVYSATIMLWLVISRGSPTGEPWPLFLYAATHPIFQMVLCVVGAGGAENAAKSLARLEFPWGWGQATMGPGVATLVIGAVMAAHVFLGWLVAGRAVGRLRKKVF
jgi:ABC-type transport system involved in multi-copper enzyme maturation permease subunit